MSAPTFEACMAAAIDEYVRSWLDEHPLEAPLLAA